MNGPSRLDGEQTPPRRERHDRVYGHALRRTAGVIAALLFAVVGQTFVAPVAHAQPIGTVLVIPGDSIDLAAIRLRTSRGCPATANAYYTRMFGQGFPAEGLVVTTNISAGLSFTTGFDVYLAQTMKDFADLNGVPVLAGRYNFVVYCIDKFPTRVKGEFTGALEFTSPTTYRAIGESMPSGPPPAPLVVGGDGLPVEEGLNPADSAATPPELGVPDPAAPPVEATSGAVAPPGSDPAAASPPPAAAAGPDVAPRSAGTGTSFVPLVLIGLLVVVPGVVAVLQGRRRRRSP